VHYGAIPYALTHPGTHCDLLRAHTRGVLAESVACRHARFLGGEAGLLGGAGPQLPAWESALTAMFVHASFLHVFGNVLALAIFGPSVEDAMGRLRFAAFYLLGGLAALAAQLAAAPSSTAPVLGASGAVAAVLGGYLLLYPRARVLSLVFVVFIVTIVEVPAVLLLVLWFAEQLWLGLEGLAGASGVESSGAGVGVAWLAPIGGFAFGVLAVRLLVRRACAPRPLAPA